METAYNMRQRRVEVGGSKEGRRGSREEGRGGEGRGGGVVTADPFDRLFPPYVSPKSDPSFPPLVKYLNKTREISYFFASCTLLACVIEIGILMI